MTRFKAVLLAGATALTVGAQTPVQNPTPKTYAQKLVNDTLAKHPDVVILAMHVVSKDGGEDYPILASNIGRYGKKADEDDLRVIKTGKNNLEVNKTGNHFEVELPLQDVNKKTIGAVGIVFNYKPGDDKRAFERKAIAIRDELTAETPSVDRLYGAP
jgi:hypothetical protein